jgi:hypothetical protein
MLQRLIPTITNMMRLQLRFFIVAAIVSLMPDPRIPRLIRVQGASIPRCRPDAAHAAAHTWRRSASRNAFEASRRTAGSRVA